MPLPTIFKSPYASENPLKCACKNGSGTNVSVKVGMPQIPQTTTGGPLITRSDEAAVIIRNARARGFSTVQGS